MGVGSASAALCRASPLTPAIPARSKCWGRNRAGQLGLGDTLDRGRGANDMGANLTSVDLGAGWTVVEVAAGGFHTCARLENGAARALKCWGGNNGALGLGDIYNRGNRGGSMGDSLPAVQLGTGRSAVALALGDVHTCALLDDASVKCWGNNVFGELGFYTHNRDEHGDQPGDMGDSLFMVPVCSSFWTCGNTVLLAAGSSHTCAVLDDGELCAPRPLPLPWMGCFSLA